MGGSAPIYLRGVPLLFFFTLLDQWKNIPGHLIVILVGNAVHSPNTHRNITNKIYRMVRGGQRRDVLVPKIVPLEYLQNNNYNRRAPGGLPKFPRAFFCELCF